MSVLVTATSSSAIQGELTNTARALGLPMRRNLAWTLTGNTVYALSQWGVLMAAAKLGPKEMVGQLALGFATTAPLFLLANLRLRAVQATDAAEEFRLADYLSLRALSTMVALLCVLAVVRGIGFAPAGALAILGVALAKSVESGSDVLYGFFQQWERMDWIAVSMILRGALSLAAVVVAIRVAHTAAMAAVALAFGWGVVFLAFDIPAVIILSKRLGRGMPRMAMSRPAMSSLAIQSLPLGLSAMLMSFGANLPRYFVEHYLGDAQLGVFSAVAYLSIAGNSVVSALVDAASPRLAQYYISVKLHALRRLLSRLLLAAAVGGVLQILVAVAAGPVLLTWFYRADYADQEPLLVWLMFASAMSYLASVLNGGLIAARRFKVHLMALMLMTAITATGCLALVPRAGSVGTAVAVTLGYTAQAAVGFWVIARALRQKAAGSLEFHPAAGIVRYQPESGQ